MSYLNIISEDKNLISYRPKMRSLGKSVTGTILLQQIIYWYKKNDCKPFYKFKQACKHENYRAGDSWCEELGFSREEFDKALSNIAKKVTKECNKKELLEDNIVLYWSTLDRKTYYEINIPLLEKRLGEIYSEPCEEPSEEPCEEPTLPKAGNPLYEERETRFTNSGKATLYNTKTTTETTTDINKEIKKESNFPKQQGKEKKEDVADNELTYIERVGKSQWGLLKKCDTSGLSNKKKLFVVDWLEYKLEEKKQPYKAKSGMQRVINLFKKYSEASLDAAIESAIVGGHAGLFPKEKDVGKPAAVLKNIEFNQNSPPGKPAIRGFRKDWEE